MKLYDASMFDNARLKDKLMFMCDKCGIKFFRSKRIKLSTMRRKGNVDHCNQSCAQSTGTTLPCKHCGKLVYRGKQQLQRYNGAAFCNLSCAALYSNSNRSYNPSVSKLEKWLQEKIISLYPKLEFQFNKNKAINSQLDIFIPSLKLAFELNGPFHYEPIFGEPQLKRMQNNDQRKLQACLEHGIELCIIDTSHQRYFKEKTSQPFLNIILDIINQKLIHPVLCSP